MLQEIDWPIIATALATFISTVWLAYKGWSDAQKKPAVQGDSKIISAAIQDSSSIRNNSTALRENTQELRQNTEELRAINASLTRLADIALIMGRRP